MNFNRTSVVIIALAVAGAAAASTVSTLTGFQVLSNIAKARGVVISSRDASTLTTAPGIFLQTAAASGLASDLQLSPQVFGALVRSANRPVSAELATQATMQAISGRNLLANDIAKLVEKNPGLLVANVTAFAAVINNAALLSQINAVVETSKQPVTARGGGK